MRDSELFITGLWVAPERRGNGYGAMMIELAEITERPNIVRAIPVPQSAGFYEKCGFVADAEHCVVTRPSKSLK